MDAHDGGDDGCGEDDVRRAADVAEKQFNRPRKGLKVPFRAGNSFYNIVLVLLKDKLI